MCTVPTRDRGPGGISSEDFPSKARSTFALNAMVSLLSHGEVPSHRLSASPSISQELNRNVNRKSEIPVTVNSTTVKCLMVRPQRYSTLQTPISGYQPQFGSDRLAMIHLAVCMLGNDFVQNVVVCHITISDLSRRMTVHYNLRQLGPHRSNLKQTTYRASHLQLRMQLAEKQTTNRMCIPVQ